jgi:hypothetical protein
MNYERQLDRAQDLRLRGDWKSSLRACREAIRSLPGSARFERLPFEILAGEALAELGRLDEARALLHQCDGVIAEHTSGADLARIRESREVENWQRRRAWCHAGLARAYALTREWERVAAYADSARATSGFHGLHHPPSARSSV